MSRLRKFVLFVLVISLGSVSAVVRVVCTAALIDDNYQEREKQYTRSLTSLRRLGLDPYVVESCKQGPTFLNKYSNHVIYTQSNDASIKNKGVNEAVSLIIALKQWNFDPEDIIVKITGRYAVLTNDFFKLIEQNPDADIFVRAFSDHDIYSGLFAMRYKYFMEVLENIDFDIMANRPIAFEHIFGNYVNDVKNKLKIVYLERVYDYLPICQSHR